MGCGVEVQDKHVKDLASFDLDSLRWNKVVICTDADVDGFQIRTLILTMLYRLHPHPDPAGPMSTSRSPPCTRSPVRKRPGLPTRTRKKRHRRLSGGKKVRCAALQGPGRERARYDVADHYEPETRRLIKVMPEDVERTAQVFDLLLGDDLQGRKSHIADNGYKISGAGGHLVIISSRAAGRGPMSDDSIVMFGFSILCIFFLLLGIILYRTDAAIQALCYFKDGGIYLVKNGRRLADDTPEDRRRLADGWGAL